MAKEHTKLEIINESPKEAAHKVNMTLDPEAVEMIFGTPNSPKNGTNTHLNNERGHDRFHNSNNSNNKVANEVDLEQPSQPLLEPDKDRQKPPLAGPEIDDLEDVVSNPADATPFPGIDDGLLEPGDTKPEVHDPEGGLDEKPADGDNTTHDDGVGTEDGKWPWHSGGDEPDFPYDDTNGFGVRFGADDRPISPAPGSTPDVNTYQQKKNLAQGMMDLALLSANANQLRYVMESSTNHPYYYSSLTLISLSIVFQIVVGIGLIMNSRYDVNDKKEICKADKINNMTVLGIFMITIVNVFITSFSVASPTVVVAAVGPGTVAIQQAGSL